MARQLKVQVTDIQGFQPAFDSLVKFDYHEQATRVTAAPYYQRISH